VRWVKRGRIFEAAGQAPWIGTHTALPAVDPVEDPERVFFTSRDRRGRSHIGFCNLSLDSTGGFADVSALPVLSPGNLGAFDDAGVTNSCLVRHDGRTYLYYTGWCLGVSVPFYLCAGLAMSDDGVSFRRTSEAPLLERSATDPFLTASPWVLVEGATWRMWYISGTEWEVVDGKPRHKYLIKYAESRDGRQWSRQGAVCIKYQGPDEYAFGRPCVLRDESGYRMWYSCRGANYRLGYAESNDGIAWTRKDDQAGLCASATGWDSEMVTYPVVFRDRGRLHMLYNGNGYGRSGIGLATAE
jgi:hypothetical protein